MTKIFKAFLLTLVLSACSVNIDQPTTPVTPLSTVPTEIPSQPNEVTTSQMQVTWSDLHLSGRLVYINGISVNDVFSLQIQVLDLTTGEVTTIFDAPKYSWIYYLSVSPDQKQLLMSYSPPPTGSEPPDQDL